MEKSFGAREVRVRLGLTQTQLADKLHVTPEYVSMVERGSKPLSPKLSKRLCELVTETNQAVSLDSSGDRRLVALEAENARLLADRDYLRDQLAAALRSLEAALAGGWPQRGAAPVCGAAAGGTTDKREA
jgi:transcriptional regulator with XRE-family HTH domain